MSTNFNLQFICLGDDNMHIRTVLGALVVGLSLGGLTSVSTAQAKTWHYKVTKSNQFSTTHYSRAFMYGGDNDDFVWLYDTAKGANEKDPFHTVNILSDTNRNLTYYAKKNTTYKGRVANLKYHSRVFYINLKDVHLRRYNTWRSGHKLISLSKPTHPSYIMLKAKTHVYQNQEWLYNYGSSYDGYYLHYRLSKKR